MSTACDRTQQRDATTGDDALFDGGLGGRHRVFDAVLLLLEFDLGGRTDLEDGDAAGQLGEALLELLAVVVGVGVLDLGLDLVDPALDVVFRTRTFDDGGLVLGDDDALGLAEQVERDGLELEPDLFADDLGSGDGRHVLQHRLATFAEAGGLDGSRLEGAADLVDDDRGECLTVDVLGDDDERATGLHDLLEDRDEVADRRDLRRHEQQVRIVERRLHALGVGDHVRRQVALVEAHALDEVHLHAEGLAFLDGDDAVLADLVDRLGDHLADLGIGRGDAGDLSDLRGGVDLDRHVLDRLDGCGDAGFDAALEAHRVGAGGEVAQAAADHRPREHGGGGGAVTGDVVGLLGDFLDQLGADALVADP